MFFLVDCNSFFASCEKVFRPDLLGKPVVVLSNNDGCIVSLTKEAKKLGLKRGNPIFKHKECINKNQVQVFSSNFTLYGDLSNRVLATIQSHYQHCEVYSIDECFIQPPNEPMDRLIQEAHQLKRTIQQWTGIPVSIGIGKTKTLAKIANHIAKANHYGVYHCQKNDPTLDAIHVSEVWGIGHTHSKFLDKHGINTIKKLQNTSEKFVLKHLKKPGHQTYKELNGTPCISLETQKKDNKTIISSRTFGKKITTLEGLKSAIANNITRACERLRKQGLVAQNVLITIQTHRHKENYYKKSILSTHPIATDSTTLLVEAALERLPDIYIPNLDYNKSGIVLLNLHPNTFRQSHLFSTPHTNIKQQEAAMKALDIINQKWGRDTLKLARINTHQNTWKMNQTHRSQRYTTAWQEILTVS